MKTLILASGSPSRRQILEKAGIPFRVEASTFEEDMTQELTPKDLAIRLSQGKAHEVASRVSNGVVLAADSFAVFEGRLLGKPHTKERAQEMLESLSGNQHSFITGFTIVDTDTYKEVSDCVETKVYMRKLTQEQIANYINKDQPLELAGGYALQGLGGVLIRKIEGDYSNVMGLPIALVAEKLQEFGIRVL